MIRLILLLMIFTPLIFTQPFRFHKITISSPRSSTSTPPKITKSVPRTTASPKTKRSTATAAPPPAGFDIARLYKKVMHLLALNRRIKNVSRSTIAEAGRRIIVPAVIINDMRESALSNKSKPIKPQNFLMKLEQNYQQYGLDGVHVDMKPVWAEVMKGYFFEAEQTRPSSELNDLERFLEKVLEDFNFSVLTKVYKDSEKAWKDYVKAFGKEYAPEEKEMRKAIFVKNYKYMEKHNDLFVIGTVSYSVMLNHLSDRTDDELKKMKGFKVHNVTKLAHPKRSRAGNDTKYYHYSRDSKVPTSVDWRNKGYVTPVKFQGDCGSCYAFAGIGALEAYHKKKTGNLINLSVQNILDCTWDLGNDGCDGGSVNSLFDYARSKGVESNARYPYTVNASRNCQWKSEYAIAYDKDYFVVPKHREVTLQHAIANHGPVAVAIGTAGDFHNYGSGIFENSKCGPANHAVLIVGYGTDSVWGLLDC